MSLTFHWFLPTNGDSRHVVGGGHGTPVTAAGGDRPPTVRYLAQIARAAEDLGFAGALTPTGAWCEDAWLTTAMVSQHTERLKFLVAFRPGFVSPTLAAQMASTFQRQSGGRLLLNVVTGGESHEQRAYGDFLDKDARYARTGEFLEIVRQLWDGKTVDLAGEHLRVEEARLTRLPDPVPE
ncbi:LLM class flavin-dependent oxidoreductase, partial [Streptomyces sp. SID4931]